MTSPLLFCPPRPPVALDADTTKIGFGQDDAGEILQPFDFGGRQRRPLLAIDQAQRTEACAIIGTQRHSGIEKGGKIADDGRIVAKSRLVRPVGHHVGLSCGTDISPEADVSLLSTPPDTSRRLYPPRLLLH